MAEISLYLDSSVWSCRFNDHVPDLQAQTIEFFDRVQNDDEVEAFLSDVVLQELGNAPAERLTKVSKLIQDVDPLSINLDEESTDLADAYIRHGILAAGHLMDARHVAIATVGELDALVSWNYRHLVNRRRREAFNGVNAIMGYRPIEIVSPPEVFND